MLAIIDQSFILFTDKNRIYMSDIDYSQMDPRDAEDLKEYRKTIDVSSFSTEACSRRVEKPWGFEIHFVPEGLPYNGKLLHVNEGDLLSIQVHDEKQETYMYAYGNISLMLENSEGNMEKVTLEEHQGYTSLLGQRHTIVGGEGGGAVFEASMPESGRTYRLIDKYGRKKAEDAEEREKRNKGEKVW